MLGVTFGAKHSFHDMGLMLRKYPEISPPAPVIKQVEVPGMDGLLDISKILTGHLLYKRRTIRMEFSILGPREEWPEKHSEIMDALHGEEMEIVLDDDPDYFYTGRLIVEGYDPEKVTSGVTITADVEPYKTKKEKRIFRVSVDGSKKVLITVSKKPVIPTITANSGSNITMHFGGNSYLLQPGANIFPDVVLRNGENALTFEGNGTASLEFREGRF